MGMVKEKKRHGVKRKVAQESSSKLYWTRTTTCFTIASMALLLCSMCAQYWIQSTKDGMAENATNTTQHMRKRQSWSSWIGHHVYVTLEELQWLLPKNKSRRSDGYFPDTCIWRVIPDVVRPSEAKNRSQAWRIREYEFWDEVSQTWTGQRPEECTILSRGDLVMNGSRSPRKTADKDYGDYRVLENVWFSQGVFYKVVDAADTKEGKTLSSNIDFVTLVVHDVRMFELNTKMRFVPGETVMIDFSYFIHPTAIGHWLEYLLPLMSMRRIEGFFKSPDTILLMHLKRSFVFEWVRAALGAALGVDRKGTLSPIIFQEETRAVWSQISTTFENLPRDEWVCFEKIIVAKDMIDGGPRTAFNGSRDASIFRKRMHRLYGIKTRAVSIRNDRDRKITLLHKAANRRIQNRSDLKALLSKFGTVSEYEFTDQVPMAKQMNIISQTHILVSAHTSGLANAMFLPPGALVLELRHRNFMTILEVTFEQQIRTLGDVKHTYWKAMKEEEGPYIHPDDERKFGGKFWANEKCNTEDCVEAHTLVDLVVNLTAIEHLLREHIPL